MGREEERNGDGRKRRGRERKEGRRRGLRKKRRGKKGKE